MLKVLARVSIEASIRSFYWLQLEQVQAKNAELQFRNYIIQCTVKPVQTEL